MKSYKVMVNPILIHNSENVSMTTFVKKKGGVAKTQWLSSRSSIVRSEKWKFRAQLSIHKIIDTIKQRRYYESAHRQTS